MKTMLKTAVVLTVVALAFSTGSVKAESTVSVDATPVDMEMGSQWWTWTNFGGEVVGWAVGGAVGGAVETTLVGSPVGIAASAGAGAVAGAAAGAGFYASTQAWNHFFGAYKENLIVPATTLD